MKSWKKYLRYAAYVLIASGLLYGLLQLIFAGYSTPWTGFQAKTLWDWMELLIIPFVLAVGAFFLNRTERAIEREAVQKRAELEREIAKDRQQEAALQAYFGRMSELLLKEKLRTTKKKEVRDVARTLTISAMRGLDKDRNNQIVQFLLEANLASEKTSIFAGTKMNGIDLSDVNFDNVNLENIDLSYSILQGTRFEKANLRGARLVMVDMKYSNFTDANLSKVDFLGSDLSNAVFLNTNMQDSDLFSVTVDETFFGGANLTGAVWFENNLATEEDLIGVSSFINTTMPDGTIHE